MSAQTVSRQVDLPEDLHARVAGFRPVVEELIGEELTVEDCLALVVARGLDVLLEDIIGSADAATQVAAIQLLAARHPVEVYEFIAQVLQVGEAINRESAKKRIGFGVEKS
jgi:hypothetical protein